VGLWVAVLLSWWGLYDDFAAFVVHVDVPAAVYLGGRGSPVACGVVTFTADIVGITELAAATALPANLDEIMFTGWMDKRGPKDFLYEVYLISLVETIAPFQVESQSRE
jgi:hypothetical protein